MHPTVILWDVSFTPESGTFYQQQYQCMLAIASNPAIIPRATYLA